jgi:hypothetical protein
VRPDQLERRLQERLDALGPAPRAELLYVLMLPDLERDDAIGSYWGNPKTRSFAELLIDCEEDRTLLGGAGPDVARGRALGIAKWSRPRPRSHLQTSSGRRSLRAANERGRPYRPPSHFVLRRLAAS